MLMMQSLSLDRRAMSLDRNSFDPRCLIDNSVYSMMDWVFGVNPFVDGLRAQQMTGSVALNARSFVILQDAARITAHCV